MRVFGKSAAKTICAVLLLTLTAMGGKMASAQGRTTIPDEAVYLGTEMGGAFVVLRRQDVRTGDGRILPAFYMELYWAGSNGKAYGVDRVGGHIFSGMGLYVPSERVYETTNDYTPPSVDFILKNGWVNSDTLYFQPEPHPDDPYGEFTAMIMPVTLEEE